MNGTRSTYAITKTSIAYTASLMVCVAFRAQVQPKFHGVPIVVLLLAALLLLQGVLLGRH